MEYGFGLFENLENHYHFDKNFTKRLIIFNFIFFLDSKYYPNLNIVPTSFRWSNLKAKLTLTFYFLGSKVIIVLRFNIKYS